MARPAPGLRPRVPAPAGPPRLRVVSPARLAARARRRRARLVTFAAVAIVTGSLFGVVAFHVVLAQGQLQLQQLQDRQTAEQTRNQRLELDVAQLTSPGRIVAAAQQQLGMIAPASVTYLLPVSPTDPSVAGAPALQGTPRSPSPSSASSSGAGPGPRSALAAPRPTPATSASPSRATTAPGSGAASLGHPTSPSSPTGSRSGHSTTTATVTDGSAARGSGSAASSPSPRHASGQASSSGTPTGTGRPR